MSEHIRPLSIQWDGPEDDPRLALTLNQKLDLEDRYRAGSRIGFVYGLVTGALGIAILSVVVLGDVIRG